MCGLGAGRAAGWLVGRLALLLAFGLIDETAAGLMGGLAVVRHSGANLELLVGMLGRLRGLLAVGHRVGLRAGLIAGLAAGLTAGLAAGQLDVGRQVGLHAE